MSYYPDEYFPYFSYRWLKCSCSYTESSLEFEAMIDFTNPKSLISEHFTVGELCMLHAWGRLATEEDGLDKSKIIMLAHMAEEVRGFLGLPIVVHCGFRSVAYNKSQ